MTIKKILFLEPMADFTVIAKAMREGKRLNGSKIYLPSKNHKRKLLDAAIAARIDCEENLLSYSTIDHEYDDELYIVSMELATTLINIIKSCSLAIFGKRDHFIGEQYLQAAKVHLHDQLAGSMRKYIDFDKRITETLADEIIYIPRPGPHWRDNFLYLQRTYPELSIKIFRNHWLPGHLDKYSPKNLAIPQSNINKVSCRPTINHRQDFINPNIFFCTNLVASQFRDSVIPLLEGLLKKTNVICYNFAGVVDDTALTGIYKKVENLPYKLKICQRDTLVKPKIASEEEAKFLHLMVKRFCSAISKRDDRYAQFDTVLKTLLYTRVLPFLIDMKTQHKGLSKALKLSNLLVVVPGRSSDALLLAAIAKSKSIPSIEIQSGVISKFRRFVKPQTEEIIALEPYGKSVYTDFLGFPSEKVNVLGFIKLELDTAPYRKISKEQIKQELTNHDVSKDFRTVVLATQPIGVDHASEIARVALAGVKALENVQLVIKPHPSEDEAYFHAYRNIAREMNVKNYTILTNFSIMPLIIASDVMMTYFSTVGLEAFALNRPVICINPFDTRPPVDLVELGVSLEAKTGSDLKSLLGDYLSDNIDTALHDPLLDRLRDGMGIRRIQEHLVDRAFNHLHN